MNFLEPHRALLLHTAECMYEDDDNDDDDDELFSPKFRATLCMKMISSTMHVLNALLGAGLENAAATFRGMFGSPHSKIAAMSASVCLCLPLSAFILFCLFLLSVSTVCFCLPLWEKNKSLRLSHHTQRAKTPAS